MNQFFNTYEFSNINNDINKFILLLQKVFTHINIWMIGKNSASHHYMKKQIMTVTYTWKILLKRFKIKIQENAMICMIKAINYCQLMYFKTFQICVEIYELNLPHFLSALRLSWQADLITTKVKLDLLTNIGMFLMVKKVSEQEYVTLFICKS